VGTVEKGEKVPGLKRISIGDRGGGRILSTKTAKVARVVPWLEKRAIMLAMGSSGAVVRRGSARGRDAVSQEESLPKGGKLE